MASCTTHSLQLLSSLVWLSGPTTLNLYYNFRYYIPVYVLLPVSKLKSIQNNCALLLAISRKLHDCEQVVCTKKVCHFLLSQK